MKKSVIKNISELAVKSEDHLLDISAFMLCIFPFAVAVIRSAITAITYDEAITYLHFARENMFDRETLTFFYSGEGCIANNHWLNSFLIHILCKITQTEYSEFIIRLPSLCAYAIFLIAAYLCFRKKIFSFPTLVFLTGNYYLNEFYGLARGYGMANTFEFLFFMNYIQWKNSDYEKMKYLNLAMICALMAIFSNTVVLLIYPAVGIVCLYKLITHHKFRLFLHKCGCIFLFFIAFSCLMINFHFNISAEGKPMITGGNNSFFNSFVKGYTQMFISAEPFLSVLSVILSVVFLLSIIKIGKKIKELDMGLMMILFIITIFAVHPLTKKNYPGTRALLPFYGFMVLSLFEIIHTAFDLQFMSRATAFPAFVRNFAVFFLCATCIILFSSQINLHSTKDWKNDYRYRTLEMGSAMTGKSYGEGWTHPSIEFYIQKNEAVINEFYSYLPEDLR